MPPTSALPSKYTPMPVSSALIASLMPLDAFDDWAPLDAGGLTDLGAAFTELNEKLSKNGFMDRGSASSGFYAPVIILLSDGGPTDDYLSALKVLKQNKWYKSALKIAIAIGEDANRDVLKKAIGNVELLFSVNDTGNLKKAIRFIAVTSSLRPQYPRIMPKKKPICQMSDRQMPSINLQMLSKPHLKRMMQVFRQYPLKN